MNYPSDLDVITEAETLLKKRYTKWLLLRENISELMRHKEAFGKEYMALNEVLNKMDKLDNEYGY